MSGMLAGAAAGATVSIVISAVDKFSSVFASVNKTMLVTGAAITGLGIAGLAASKTLVDTAASFESAFAGVRKTVELTETEFEKLRQNFKDLSKEIPVSFVELSKIGEIAGQLGVEGVDNITKFTKTIADISATTNLTADEAATSFARFANIMGMPIEEVDRLGSVVVALGNNFATTEQEIVNMGMRISGAGAALNMTEGQVMSWGAALSSVGIAAEMGGTAISKMMINVSSMVSSGSEDLEGFAKVAGMTSEEFSKAFKEDASKALETFFVGLGQVKEGGGDVLAVMEELDIKEVRLRDAVLRLSGGSDILTESLRMQQGEWDKNTALVDEANKRYGTTESQVQILKNKFDSLKDQMGQTLIPAFIKLVDILGKVFTWLEKHPTLTKFAVAALAIGSALAVIVGPLIMLIAMLPLFAAGLGMITAAALPITLAILAIAAAIVAVVAAYKAFKSFFSKESKEDERKKKQEEFAKLNPDLVGSSKSSSSSKSKKDWDYQDSDANKALYEQQKNKYPTSTNLGPAISLNDFIVTKGGKIIKPSPQDTIIGTKRPQDLGSGGGINITIGEVNGVDADEISQSLAREIKRVIRL